MNERRWGRECAGPRPSSRGNILAVRAYYLADQGLLWARNSGEKIEPKTRPETSNGPADEEQVKQLKTQQTAPAKPQKPEQKEHATSNGRPTPIPLAKTTKRRQEQSQRAHKRHATAAAGEQPRTRDPPQPPRRRQGRTNHAGARVRPGVQTPPTSATTSSNQEPPHLRSPCAA